MKTSLTLLALAMASASSLAYSASSNSKSSETTIVRTTPMKSAELNVREARSEKSIHNQLSASAQASYVRKTPKNTALSFKEDGKVKIATRSKLKELRKLSKNEPNSSPKLRSTQPQKSAAFGFSFYSADSVLNFDLDGDGYYSDFTLEFDADYDNGAADVFAVIYYSKDNGPWTELAETNVFSIYSDNANDEYSISTTLNSGYPTDDYDILIDLYEDGVAGVVATISSDDVNSLFALPLEDEEHEVTANTSQISYVATDLFGDSDADGFYTDLTIEYDIDAQYSGDVVYAEIVMFNNSAGWQQVLTSNNFILGNNTEFIDLTFNDGYSAGWYDVEINLINAFTGEVITDAGREFSSLTGLPIESINNDSYYDSTIDADVDVHISGGGSLGWGVLMLSALGLWRKRVLKIVQ
ncbi:MAG: choice-of-anchor H family protein [Kangiellaceae bacterium]|nr:choice-of-anchor H family protein [Kangiellaceae bacterium]